jgi:hypothetical protein
LSHLPPGSYLKGIGSRHTNLSVPPVARFNPLDNRKTLRISQTWASSCTVCHFSSGGLPQLARLKNSTSTTGRAIAAADASRVDLVMYTARIPASISLWNLVGPPINVAKSSTPSRTCCRSTSSHLAGLKAWIRYRVENLSSMVALGSLSTTGLEEVGSLRRRHSYCIPPFAHSSSGRGIVGVAGARRVSSV